MPGSIDERIAYDISDLLRLLPIKRAAAYALMRQLGVRIGRRRLVVPKARFDAWLTNSHVDEPRAGGES